MFHMLFFLDFNTYILKYVKVEYVFSSANELELLLLKSVNYVWACLCYNQIINAVWYYSILI